MIIIPDIPNIVIEDVSVADAITLTVRLQKALRQMGLTVGGQAGAEVGSKQGLSGSRDTILRLVRTTEPSATVPPNLQSASVVRATPC
jgi:hypothetical protein